MKYVLIILLFYSTIIFAHNFYPFHSQKKQQQFQYLIHQFRCVVCQDESLSESNASIAVELRKEIYLKVKNNQSNAEITQYLVNRYGNFILLKPPFIPETYLLWLLPALLIFSGIFIIIKMFTPEK